MNLCVIYDFKLTWSKLDKYWYLINWFYGLYNKQIKWIKGKIVVYELFFRNLDISELEMFNRLIYFTNIQCFIYKQYSSNYYSSICFCIWIRILKTWIRKKNTALQNKSAVQTFKAFVVNDLKLWNLISRNNMQTNVNRFLKEHLGRQKHDP